MNHPSTPPEYCNFLISILNPDNDIFRVAIKIPVSVFSMGKLDRLTTTGFNQLVRGLLPKDLQDLGPLIEMVPIGHIHLVGEA